MSEEVQSEFEIIAGTGNIILVAPHGCPGDDTNTAPLTRLLARQLNCRTVINEVYRKTKWNDINGTWLQESIDLYCNEVDLNSVIQVEQAGLKKKWLGTMERFKQEILQEHNTCLVFIILGASDKNIQKVNRDADVLLGVGRVKADAGLHDRATADDAVVEHFTRMLKEQGSLTAVVARVAQKDSADPDNRYAGHNSNDLIQYIAAPVPRAQGKTIHAVQIVLNESGLRDSAENIGAAADILSQAISRLEGVAVHFVQKTGATEVPVPDVEQQPDAELVAEAYSELKNIFVTRYEEARNRAMLDAGNYIIKTFYDQNYQLAKNKNQAAKKKSLHRLIRKLQKQSGDTPSKTWIYDAVGLAVDEHELESFRTYGKISVSHKLKLLKVKDLETKKQLIAETVSRPLSVRQLAIRVKEETGGEPELADLIRQPDKLFSGEYAPWYSQQSLKALEPEKRAALAERINCYTAKIQDEISKQQKYLEQYAQILARLERG